MVLCLAFYVNRKLPLDDLTSAPSSSGLAINLKSSLGQQRRQSGHRLAVFVPCHYIQIFPGYQIRDGVEVGPVLLLDEVTDLSFLQLMSACEQSVSDWKTLISDWNFSWWTGRCR